jgi:crotonobetainyl-CoA:carnitine CoA-transferase CaiB-like acyl-CoA transferase
VLSAYAEDHWHRFCQAVDRPDLARDPRFANNALRVEHRGALRVELARCLAAYTSEQCVALLTRHHIVVGAVRRYREVLESADVQASGIFVSAGGGHEAPYRAVGLPYRIGEGPRPQLPAAPACGADSAAVLAEIGCSEAEIDVLRRDRTIA